MHDNFEVIAIVTEASHPEEGVLEVLLLYKDLLFAPVKLGHAHEFLGMSTGLKFDQFIWLYK